MYRQIIESRRQSIERQKQLQQSAQKPGGVRAKNDYFSSSPNQQNTSNKAHSSKQKTLKAKVNLLASANLEIKQGLQQLVEMAANETVNVKNNKVASQEKIKSRQTFKFASQHLNATSRKQLSQIERTSQNQHDSITRLQSKLVKTQKLASSKFQNAPSDYEMSNQESNVRQSGSLQSSFLNLKGNSNRLEESKYGSQVALSGSRYKMTTRGRQTALTPLKDLRGQSKASAASKKNLNQSMTSAFTPNEHNLTYLAANKPRIAPIMTRSTFMSPSNAIGIVGSNADLMLDDQGLETPQRMRQTTTNRNFTNGSHPSTTISKKTTSVRAGKTASAFFNQSKLNQYNSGEIRDIVAVSTTVSPSAKMQQNLATPVQAVKTSAESQQKTASVSGAMNTQYVSQLIDQLDLQESIRKKAQVLFSSQQKLPQQGQDAYSKMLRKPDGEGSQSPSKASGKKRKSNGADDEQSSVFYSERKVATQNEIKRRLDKLIQKGKESNFLNQLNDRSSSEEKCDGLTTSQNYEETLQLTEGQIFDKEQDHMHSLGTSIGNSIIPPDAPAGNNEEMAIAENPMTTIASNQQAFPQTATNRTLSSAKVNDEMQLSHVSFMLDRVDMNLIDANSKKSKNGRTSVTNDSLPYDSSKRSACRPSKLALTPSQNQLKLQQPQKAGGAAKNRGDSDMARMEEINLVALAQEYKQAQKEKMAKTMYNRRQVEPKHKLASFKQDYSQYVLGEYRFGLNQKAPISKDPNAAPSLRFTQLPSYRFAENNKRYMELYEQQIVEFRKTRRFLSQQINKSPVGKAYAEQVHAESPLLKKMHRKLQLQLIEETIRQEELAMQNKEKKKDINGLRGIQQHNREQKAKMQKKQELNSVENVLSNRTSQESLIRRMRHQKSVAFDALLNGNSIGTLNSGQESLTHQSQNSKLLQKSAAIFGLVSPRSNGTVRNPDQIAGLDLNEDFFSDPGSEDQVKMKKVQYEMDEFLTRHLFKDDLLKMGLSLYYTQQETEQRRHFRQQQKQLMNYLSILFGKSIDSTAHIEMAKELTKKLRRQGTDDSHTRQRAREIQLEQTANLDIDQENINTEIVGLLAEEILKKTEFFDIYKGNVRGQKGLIQQSQLIRLQKKEAENEFNHDNLSSQKTALFKRVQNAFGADGQSSAYQANQLNQQRDRAPNNGFTPMDELTATRLDSTTVAEHLQHGKPNFLKQVAQNANDLVQFETEMENVEDVHKEMAKTSFITQCEKNLVVTLPLLLRIKDKKIVLERYQLNLGLCRALSISFHHFHDIATDFFFDSNNMSDDDFSVLLDGMSKLTYVQRLSYSNNQFGHQSLKSLMPIISKQQLKHSLQVLHLKNCKMTAKVTNDLLFALTRQKNYLRSLSLVNCNVNQTNYRELCSLIRRSRHLQELDISWNGMRCHHMYQLIDAIVENRTLQDLNLSYNNLHDSMQEMFSFSNAVDQKKYLAEKEKLANKIKNAKSNVLRKQAEYEAMDNSMKHIIKLCHFIKMNSNLMHLNLSGMGMTQQMMHEFGRALRRTKSLVSLHLSSNNGDNEELRRHINERAHVKPFMPTFRPDFKQAGIIQFDKDGSANKGRKSNFKLENSIVFEGQDDYADQKLAIGRTKISEQLNLKNMLKNKRRSVNRQAEETNTNEMLIFTRYLGHKVEMPGSGQWRMIASSNDSQQRCWSCNLEVYTLIFWSREYGLKHQHELFRDGIDEMAYENQLYELEARNEELGIKVDFNSQSGNPQLHEKGHKLLGFPLVYGDFNNWIPQRMYTIEELCYLMDTEKPDIIKNLKRSKYVREEVEKPEDMNEREKVFYNEHMFNILSKYRRMQNWRKLLGSSLRYKRPFLANAEALLLGNSDVNLAKMDEELYPSDSESDLGSNSELYSSFQEQSKSSSSCSSDNDQCNSASDGSSDDSRRMRQMNKAAKKMQNERMQRLQQQKTQAKFDKLNRDKGKMNRQLYVLPCFLKPGKQTLIVQSKLYQSDLDLSIEEAVKKMALGRRRSNDSELLSPGSDVLRDDLSDPTTEQFFFHQCVAPHRRERVPLFVKQLKRKTADSGAFDRSQTVFKDWKPPNEKDLRSMLDHDSKHWKLPRFIKDEMELKDVFNVYLNNLSKLFNTFITLSAGSNFPGIAWLDFTKFTEKIQVCKGSDSINSSDIDRYFMAAAGDMLNAGCYRYQFFEALMRVAKARFLDSGQAKDHADALEQFLETYAFKPGIDKEWQGFRDDVWWTYENHRILEANEFGLTKIYKAFWQPRKKWMNKADCLDLMLRCGKILHDEVRVVYCYGMSKMHVVAEPAQKQTYDEMKYVEFLEFLGRCAHVKYRDLEGEPMAGKLKMLLDELMPQFGLQRQEADDQEDVLSESDPDY